MGRFEVARPVDSYARIPAHSRPVINAFVRGSGGMAADNVCFQRIARLGLRKLLVIVMRIGIVMRKNFSLFSICLKRVFQFRTSEVEKKNICRKRFESVKVDYSV